VDNFSKDFNSERKESDIYYNHKPEPKKILPEEIILSNEEKILFEKLKKIRMDLSAQENVPPYFIFHDSVLKRLTRYKPLTREEMLKLPGIGENNFGKYGVHFLKALRTEKFTEKTEAQGIENEKIENKNLDIPNIGELNNVP
jgi:superfamily II DNA helicase RecQ